ncbi:hypothetical protein HY464_01380 [Candidatus Peregrinibacteria bacterium]|nr:hypothetical protein [Candidatus Peregrinibacteria bacterium]
MDRFLTFGGLIVLVGLSAYIAGRMVSIRQFADPPFWLEPDTRPLVPVVHIEGLDGGKIVGRINGEVRVFWGDVMIIPDGSGAFRIAEDLLVEETTVLVPDGMQFVASRKGKKYYSVTSPISERIKPENRMYFSTNAEAEAAGFLP